VIIRHIPFGPALALGLGLVLGHAPISLAQSVESKIEALGRPDYLVVDEIRAAKRNGLLNIQVSFRNTDTQTRAMRYRFRWLDAQGFDVGTEEAWKPLVVHGQQTVRVQTVAPTPAATDFTVQIHADENSNNPTNTLQ
jgi:hypothetical protein